MTKRLLLIDRIFSEPDSHHLDPRITISVNEGNKRMLATIFWSLPRTKLPAIWDCAGKRTLSWGWCRPQLSAASMRRWTSMRWASMSGEKSIHPVSFTHSLGWTNRFVKRCIICLVHVSPSGVVCTGCVKCWSRRKENCCERWRWKKTMCLKDKPGCAKEQSICRRNERARGKGWLLRSLINSSGSVNEQIKCSKQKQRTIRVKIRIYVMQYFHNTIMKWIRFFLGTFVLSIWWCEHTILLSRVARQLWNTDK